MIIFFLDKFDNHIRNFIIKKNSHKKISLIPIDFGLFGFYNNIGNKKEFLQDLLSKNLNKAKNNLINYVYTYKTGDLIQYILAFKKKPYFTSEINLEYQLSRISDEEFKEILKNMLSNESEINQIFDEFKKEYEKALKEKEEEHNKRYGNTDSKEKQDDLERIQIFENKMNSFLEIKDYLSELRGVVKNFDVEEDRAEEKNSSSNKIDLKKSQEISLGLKKI